MRAVSLTAVKDTKARNRNSSIMERQPAAQTECRFWGIRPTLYRLGAVVTIAAIAITVWRQYPGRPAPASNIMVLYVGAEDCAPCRAWKSGDGAAFFASQEFARITYREVKSPHVHDVLNDENWPGEIRIYRDRLQRSDGVPLWLVVSEHEVVEKQFGAAQWHANILPKIKSFLR
jgi:hypothetical protein